MFLGMGKKSPQTEDGQVELSATWAIGGVVTADVKFRTLKSTNKDVGPMTVQGMEKMIQKFEDMGYYHVQSGKGKKRRLLKKWPQQCRRSPVVVCNGEVLGELPLQWPGSYFFERTSTFGPVTFTVTGHYEYLLRNHVITDLQQCGWVDGIIFMQNGVPPHIANPVKQMFKIHFGNARVTSRHFPTVWLPLSPDLNPCNFGVWDGFWPEKCFVQCSGSTLS
ncbi:uncharacterized protein TNCV_1614731 [Trichonephila clavipes]|nr:uncharacterized protein TNCV_1614731 [Trichonephila clavipes]